MKKLFATILSLLLILTLTSFKTIKAIDYVPIAKTSGNGYVTYRGTQNQVMIPTTYTKPNADFRAAWVSPLVNDIGYYIDTNVYKAELVNILDTLEKFNMNAVIFHIRIFNDALYDSDLNIKSKYIPNANFEKWDYLEWFIGECHRRGIEFHAWLNPYRIDNTATSLNNILSQYKNYPQNPASKAENIIVGSNGAILNPGEPAVRRFVIDTCMEIIEKYDVDAIHFDDYFYASMPENADANAYNKYKNNFNANNIYDWRRLQVDEFIKTLHDTMTAYNKQNNRHVQLGISPTGIYQNGNGVVTYDSNGTAITTGSNTAGQAHYEGYLYCNSKKWVDNEWIDYIVPQSYWSFELGAAPYADVVDWWAKVVKYKNVNLYTGMGLYRKYTGDLGASWETNPMEAANQILYNNKYPEIQGTVVFNYYYLQQALYLQGMNKVINEFWQNPALTPEIRTMDTLVVPGKVENVQVSKKGDYYSLNWNNIPGARKYAVYRSEGEVDVNNPHQIVDIVGSNQFGEVIFTDKVTSNINYNYAIVAVSGTNTTGEPVYVNTVNPSATIDFHFATLANLTVNGTVFPGLKIQIIFEDATVFAGSKLTYELELSTDQTNWVKISHSELRKTGYTYSHRLTVTEVPLYARLSGTNEFGTVTSGITKINVKILGVDDYFDIVKYVFDNKIKSIFAYLQDNS